MSFKTNPASIGRGLPAGNVAGACIASPTKSSACLGCFCCTDTTAESMYRPQTSSSFDCAAVDGGMAREDRIPISRIQIPPEAVAAKVAERNDQMLLGLTGAIIYMWASARGTLFLRR